MFIQRGRLAAREAGSSPRAGRRRAGRVPRGASGAGGRGGRRRRVPAEPGGGGGGRTAAGGGRGGGDRRSLAGGGTLERRPGEDGVEVEGDVRAARAILRLDADPAA